MSNQIETAVERRDFFSICQSLSEHYPHLNGDTERVRFDKAAIASAAREAGAIEEFHRDAALAELAISSRLAIARYAASSGKQISTNDDCEIFIVRNKGDKQKEYEARVCSPIIICGEGHNEADGGACLQILVKSTKGTWIEVFARRADLTSGGLIQSRLQDAGLRPGDWAALLHILQNVDPPRKFKRLEHAGWNGGTYALPSGEVIPEDDSAIATFTPVPNFEIGGSKLQADRLLATMEGNSRLVFATAAALAAPLLAPYGPEAEPGGFHFYGCSSRGKTTVLSAAASVWGRGAEKKDNGIVESWNTTAFAAEMTASQHSDCAMFFDEVRAADPDHFAKLALGIANGAGKKAGQSDGRLRETKTFRPMLLSTGEISSKAYITSNDLAYHGGMSVRLVDIPADTSSGQGVFDVVPEQFAGDAGSFAKWLKEQAGSHFGHHGRALVSAFVADRESFLMEVREAVRMIRVELDGRGGRGDPQAGRVRDRFAFVGAVAVVASRRTIVPWSEDGIVKSIVSVFGDWFAARGGEGSQEGLAAEASFSAFVYANPGRFDFEGARADRNRLGICTWSKDRRREYWIASDEGLAEMLGGQRERIEPFIEHLKDGKSEAWELVPSSDRDKRDSPKGRNLPRRCLCIRSKLADPAWEDAANDDEPKDVKAPMPASRAMAQAAE